MKRNREREREKDRESVRDFNEIFADLELKFCVAQWSERVKERKNGVYGQWEMGKNEEKESDIHTFITWAFCVCLFVCLPHVVLRV